MTRARVSIDLIPIHLRFDWHLFSFFEKAGQNQILKVNNVLLIDVMFDIDRVCCFSMDLIDEALEPFDLRGTLTNRLVARLCELCLVLDKGSKQATVLQAVNFGPSFLSLRSINISHLFTYLTDPSAPN